ncbi:MAG: FxsA family protein [Pseudomonadota bacterium]
MVRTEKQTAAAFPIGRILLIAFIVTPLIEIAVLIQVGGWLGLWPTLGLIFLTAIIGTWMLRQQGFVVLTRAQKQLAEGSVPLGEVFEGFCLVIAGALLLTPGFVTDAIGGSLLVPPVRAWLYRTLGDRFRRAAMPPQHPGEAGPVVDGDFETVEPDLKKPSTGDETQTSSDSKPMPPPRGRWDSKE